MANVLCFDFDDTITMENTARFVFERFAAPAWREDEAVYLRGDLSVEEFNAAALDRIEPGSTTVDALKAAVRDYTILRPGFIEILDWATWNGWMCSVVSNGFDFYVDAVLDDLGVDRVARHAGRVIEGYRWRVKYLSPRGIEVQRGFKLSYAQAFRNAGDFVVYFGDGASDTPAAALASAVFARSTLWHELKDSHARVHPFETFADAQQILEREAEGWLQSFSSMTAAAD